MLNLTPHQISVVQVILRQHLSADVEVFAFGKRATGDEVTDSTPLELCLGPTAMEGALKPIRDGFADHPELPFEVRVILWARINHQLRDRIHKEQVLFPR